MYEVREKIRHAILQVCYLSACWVFDVVTPEWVGDIARSLLVLSATINIWGGAQSIKGFLPLKNVVNLQFASEVRPEVVRDIFKKVKIAQVTCLHGKKFGDKNVYNDKSDYWRLLQQEWFERGRSKKYHTVVCVACRRNNSESDRLTTRHDEEKQTAVTVVL